MKNILLALFVLIPICVIAQTDTLKSGVYSWINAAAQRSEGRERKDVVNGSTRDLDRLEIHTTTLNAGQTNHPPVAHNDVEELVIVKEGSLKVTIGDSSKILTPGGLALIVAGDKQTFQNISTKPATYYVISYKSKDGVNLERGRKGGGSFIKDWNEYEVKKTDKGESRPIFDRPSSVFKRFDVHATALNPGFASHAPHTHRAEEIILMIKGTGEMQISETFHKAVPGDVILVNSKVPHAFTNTGKEQCGYFAIQWHSNDE
ncbi:MAG: cupin protein [Segetibacter sp.]|jgi:(S)-ureidoglycine aminohydrolase|nr:cupin protein [Segetibacter sp.]